MNGGIFFGKCYEKVFRECPFDGFGNAESPDRFDFSLGVAEGGNDLIIVERRPVKIGVRSLHDCIARHPEAGKEACTEQNDTEDRKITTGRPEDLPDVIFSDRRSYHSISSIGTGCGLISMPLTVPFLIWTTRSAMAVSALLWVMIMTVIPVFLPVSDRSFRMALPVS